MANVFAVAGEKQETVADKETIALLERFALDPDVTFEEMPFLEGIGIIFFDSRSTVKRSALRHQYSVFREHGGTSDRVAFLKYFIRLASDRMNLLHLGDLAHCAAGHFPDVTEPVQTFEFDRGLINLSRLTHPGKRGTGKKLTQRLFLFRARAGIDLFKA